MVIYGEMPGENVTAMDTPSRVLQTGSTRRTEEKDDASGGPNESKRRKMSTASSAAKTSVQKVFILYKQC